MRRVCNAAVVVIVSLVGVIGVASAPAEAVRHRHHRGHRHVGRGGLVCGPGTLKMNGTCVPQTSDGTSGLTITPGDIRMTLDGNFAASVFVTGLPPLGSSAFSVATVAPTCTRLPMASLGAPDPQGRSVLTLSGVGCIAGTLTVHLTELVTPFQKFTGVLLLHS